MRDLGVLGDVWLWGRGLICLDKSGFGVCGLTNG